MTETPKPATGRGPRLLVTLALLLLAGARIGLLGDLHGTCRWLEVDDMLYARCAESIAEGCWLGDYRWQIHMKMPGFPVWLAGLRLLGIPTVIGQELLWITAVLVLYGALRRLGLGRLPAFLVYAGLLWHPSAAWNNYGFLVRETIHPAQVLLIVGLLLHLTAPASDLRRLGQALLLGLVTTFTWYSREESLWLLGPLALGLAGAVTLAWRRESRASALRLALIVILPVLVMVHGTGRLIAAINEGYYGEKIVVIFEDPDFKAALGALIRAEPEPRHRFHPIRDETIAELMKHSPAFAALRPEFEGGAYRVGTMVDPEGDRITNYVSFLLREAAAGHGRERSLGAAKSYYRQLATEVNAWLDREPERYGPRRDAVMPPLRAEDLLPIARESLALGLEVACLDLRAERAVAPTFPDSNCRPEDDALIQRLRRDPAEPSLTRWHWRYRVLREIAGGYRRALPILGIAAGLALLLAVLLRRRVGLTPVSWAGLLLVLVALMRVGMMAFVNVTYSPLDTMYLECGFLAYAGGILILVVDLLRRLPPRGLRPLLSATLPGWLGLAAILGGMTWLGLSEAGNPDRFLSLSECRRLGKGPERDAIESYGFSLSTERTPGLLLRVESTFGQLSLFPWNRQRRSATDLVVEGQLRGPLEANHLHLVIELKETPDGPWITRREPLSPRPDGQFEYRLPLSASFLGRATLAGNLQPHTVVELRRFARIPSGS